MIDHELDSRLAGKKKKSMKDITEVTDKTGRQTVISINFKFHDFDIYTVNMQDNTVALRKYTLMKEKRYLHRNFKWSPQNSMCVCARIIRDKEGEERERENERSKQMWQNVKNG